MFADVTSANIVGYTTKDAPQNSFVILGAQFESIPGGADANDLVKGVPGVNYDDDGVFKLTAPQIQIPSGIGYKVRYFLNDGWYDNGTPDGDYKAGWCNGDGEIAECELTPGIAIWIKSVQADAVANVSGAVPDDDNVSVECPEVFALRSNAFPIGWDINSEHVAFVGIAGVNYDDDGNFKQTAPQVQIPSGIGYKIRYYLNDGWYDNGTPDGDYKAGWCNADGEIVEEPLPVGGGFWTKGSGSSFTMTFVK